MEDFLVHPGKAFRKVKAKDVLYLNVCFIFEVVFDFELKVKRIVHSEMNIC